MVALLQDKVAAYVADHPSKTAYEIAMAIRARRQHVDEILASSLFKSEAGPKGARVFSLSGGRGRAGTATTHKARVLSLLSDGRPHSHMEGYRLGVMLHSRVADLRRDGYRIRCWRDGDDYLYQLVGALDEATGDKGSPVPATPVVSSSGPVGTDGNQPPFPYQEQDGVAQLTLTGPAFRKQAAA